MLQKTFQMHYHLRTGASFRRPKIMQTFLQEIAALGYHIVTLSEYETIYRRGRDFFMHSSGGNDAASSSFILPPASGDEKDPQVEAQATTPAGYLPRGVSVLALGEATKFATDQGHHLWLAAFPVAQHELTSSFTCGLAFPAQSNTASLMITLATVGFAARISDSLLVLERWLDLFTVMWRAWQPLYAHSYAPHADWPEPDDAEVQAGRLLYLYEINFLGSEMVKLSGREHVLHTPAWRVRALDQESILLIPEFIFLPRGAEARQGELAARHLVLRRFLRGHYLPTPTPSHG